jgi:hypothetical protein
MVARNKTGQLKIQQMAFMLIAVIIFFAFVGMAFLSFQLSELRSSAGTLEEKNALLLVTKLSNSPEFSCGKSFGNAKANCIDADKVMVLKENIGKYKNFWGVENIEIRKIYPPQTDEEECTIGNYPECNIIKIRDSNEGISYSNFVSLCRKEKVIFQETESIQTKCELAKLSVSYNG